MGLIGNLLGQAGGSFLGNAIGGDQGGKAGQQIGGILGNFLPFKTGGRVPGKRGKPVKALVHGGEYVLPASVPPTAEQKKAVAKLHRKEAKAKPMSKGKRGKKEKKEKM